MITIVTENNKGEKSCPKNEFMDTLKIYPSLNGKVGNL